MTLPIGKSGYNEIQMVLLIGTSRYNIRYTREYIPKLQIHQHSLLTRKVFSWHNSSAQVFITRSSSNLDHHWIIIIITASSISIKWCYLSILLITGSSTEPTLFHVGCRLSLHVGLPLQSQSFFILDVGLYRANPFSYWMYLHRASPFSYWMWVSIDPVLFHTGCGSL